LNDRITGKEVIPIRSYQLSINTLNPKKIIKQEVLT
jgi:hypothetical protein